MYVAFTLYYLLTGFVCLLATVDFAVFLHHLLDIDMPTDGSSF